MTMCPHSHSTSVLGHQKHDKAQVGKTRCTVFNMNCQSSNIIMFTNVKTIKYEICDLDVILDSKLTFGPHIDSAVGRANRALGMYVRSLPSHRATREKGFHPPH